MKCPLIREMHEADDGEFYYTHEDCLKEGCAWWDEDDKVCAIFNICSFLQVIGDNLYEIVQKMPHEEQFRK